MAHWQGQYKRSPPQEVIVFIVGGTTYEESKIVHELNERAESSTRVAIGGTGVINSTLFIETLRRSSETNGTGMGALEIMKDIAL